MEYTVAIGMGHKEKYAAAKLTEEVNRLLEDGWKPQGGVTVDVEYIQERTTYNATEKFVTYAQSMVRD